MTTHGNADVYIMSKCPDATTAINEIVVPALDKTNYQGNLKFEVIGKEEYGKFICKHGDDECTGNKWILAVQDTFNLKETVLFTQYLLNHYTEIPSIEVFKHAAQHANISFSRAQEAVESSGDDLLRKSFTKTAVNGVIYSCTIQINNKEWCVVDSGNQNGCVGGISHLADAITS